MDQFFDMLVDPVEVDDIKVETKPVIGKFPDLYRPYLFNNSNLKSHNNFTKKYLTTGALKAYWEMPINKLIEYLFAKINKYEALEPHLLTHTLTNNISLNHELIDYYNDIYDMADIIILRDRSTYNGMVTTIRTLLDSTKQNNHVIFRIIIYMSLYYIRKNIGNAVMDKFIPTIIAKLKEFNEIPKITNYFTTTELNNYRLLAKKYYKKHIQSRYNK